MDCNTTTIVNQPDFIGPIPLQRLFLNDYIRLCYGKKFEDESHERKIINRSGIIVKG